MGCGMRYSEYLKRATRLQKEIAECWNREQKAAEGKGPWFVHFIPSLRSSAIAVASRKRQALARERHRLERDFFADPAVMWNAVAVNAFRRTVPSSPEAIRLLRSAADAALDSEA